MRLSSWIDRPNTFLDTLSSQVSWEASQLYAREKKNLLNAGEEEGEKDAMKIDSRRTPGFYLVLHLTYVQYM